MLHHFLVLTCLVAARSFLLSSTSLQPWSNKKAPGSTSSEVAGSNGDETEIQKLNATELKRELLQNKVTPAGIVDKAELVKLLAEVRRKASSSQRKLHASARASFVKKSPPSTLPGFEKGLGPKSYLCVRLSISGLPFEFLVDSGATPCIITEATRAKLNAQLLDGGQRIEGVAAGGASTAPRVMLQGVCLGDATRSMINMDALVTPTVGVLPDGVDGLLGIKYLSLFGIVDFDFRQSVLSVYSYDARTEDGSQKLHELLDGVCEQGLEERGLPMRQDPLSGLYFVDMHVSSRQSPAVPALIDLGSSCSMCNWAAAEQVGISRSDSSRVRRNVMAVYGIDKQTCPVDLAQIGGLYLDGGRMSLELRSLAVADLPAWDLIGFRGRPAGLIGMDVLGGSKGRTIFDFRDGKLFII